MTEIKKLLTKLKEIAYDVDEFNTSLCQEIVDTADDLESEIGNIKYSLDCTETKFYDIKKAIGNAGDFIENIEDDLEQIKDDLNI